MLLLVIPAAVIAGLLAAWLKSDPEHVTSSEFFTNMDGDQLVRMFSGGAPNVDFNQIRCRSHSDTTPQRGDWTREFVGGLWSDQSAADPVIRSFRRKVEQDVQKRGGKIRDEQESLDGPKLVGFRFSYTLEKHVGKLNAYYGPEKAGGAFNEQRYRRLHVRIVEQTDTGPAANSRENPIQDR